MAQATINTATFTKAPAQVQTPRVLRNERTGEEITSPYSNAEAAARLVALAGEGHWLWFWIHKYVQDAEASGSPKLTNAMRRVSHMFLLSIGYGLKRPKIRVVYKDVRFQLYLSRRGTLCIKAADRKGETDNWTAERYIGCVYGGRFLKAKEYPQLLDQEQEFLDRLAADPVGFLAICSKDMGCCCYCNHSLDDPQSKEVGYGPVCAKRWGLPWGKDAYQEKAPSFARSYNQEAADLMDAIQAEPFEDAHWERLGDWLEAHRLPRTAKPEYGVTIPAK